MITPGANFPDGCLNDINMLNVTKGSVRTFDEYKLLFDISGFTIVKNTAFRRCITNDRACHWRIEMKNYVLVHGGDRDGSIWSDVEKTLTNHGHKVFCPSMTSVKKATLQENISEIISYIQSKNLDNFILVGHSYGGFVITGVADQLPDFISAIVYVDSLIPKNGKSLYDLALDSNFDYESFGLTKDPGVISKIYFDAKKVFSRENIYIHCLKSEFILLTKPIYNDLKNSNDDWLFFCLDTTHSPMFTQPRELSIILLGIGSH